jgi:hypothetical protein
LSNFFESLSKNSYFIIFTGFCSIISLVVTYINDNVVIWSILTISIFTFITLTKLVKQNSRMFRRLDDLNCEIFNQNVDLEFDEDNDIYKSQLPIIIVMTSFLTPETISKKPIVWVQVDFPPQLNLDFNLTTDNITKDTTSSNSVRFKVTVKSEASVMAIRNLSLSKDKETEFSETTKKINIKFESDLLLEPKTENLFVSV